MGIGLRDQHVETILGERPAVPWFEVLIDNYLAPDAPPLRALERIRERYPITFHGVGMSLGSTDSLDRGYLRRLAGLIERFEPLWVSDHLCWTSLGGQHIHDLLPLPCTEEAAWHTATRIRQVQDFLGRRILIENVSGYLRFRISTLEEGAFLRWVAEEADCDILLDVNNIYVNTRNHGRDPLAFLSAIPAQRVRELHLGGFEERGDHLLDTHGAPVAAAVWQLYREALDRFGPIPTLLERDADLPALAVLVDEARIAERLLSAAAADAA